LSLLVQCIQRRLVAPVDVTAHLEVVSLRDMSRLIDRWRIGSYQEWTEAVGDVGWQSVW